ncbi:hypothetical protein OH77DRAFT_126165 [Trametes cingulata]|nr:hypothetical protein OH77DRAFT_126165 [Trametes cingulata]
MPSRPTRAHDARTPTTYPPRRMQSRARPQPRPERDPVPQSEGMRTAARGMARSGVPRDASRAHLRGFSYTNTPPEMTLMRESRVHGGCLVARSIGGPELEGIKEGGQPWARERRTCAGDGGLGRQMGTMPGGRTRFGVLSCCARNECTHREDLVRRYARTD